MKQKDYIIMYKKDLKALGLETCFNNLDSLISKLKLIKTVKPNSSTIKVIDYNTDEKFDVDSNEAQELFDSFYEDYYYKHFLQKFEWCRKMLKTINHRILSSDKGVNNEFTAEQINEFAERISMIYFKTIMISFKYLVTILSDLVNYERFFSQLQENLSYSFAADKQNITLICQDLIEGLIDDGLLIKKNSNLILTEDSVRLDLIVLSFCPVQINNSESEIKYSCYYSFCTLYFIIARFLSTINFKYHEYLLQKYGTDMEKFFILNNFLENYKDFDFSKNYCFKGDFDYFLLGRIYIEKLTIHEYCNQVILNSCFENYYFSYRPNILNRRSFELAERLIP